jgi:hypothetical protein
MEEWVTLDSKDSRKDTVFFTIIHVLKVEMSRKKRWVEIEAVI